MTIVNANIDKTVTSFTFVYSTIISLFRNCSKVMEMNGLE